MADATRTIRVRFDGSAKGLIKAAAEAGIAVEAFEKQTNKSSSNIAKSTGAFSGLVSGFIDTLGTLPSVLKGAAITAAVGIGAVMAPALAGVLISGILLAVSGGVLAAGIIGAAKSPKVVNAWKKFGRQATVVFERFSKPFIQPLASAAFYFASALARAEPTIRRIGETMAPWVVELASATAIFVEKLMPGILTAVTAAGPFIDILSVHLPLIAESISRFFGKISEGSASAQVFFDRFLTWVEEMLPKLGGFLTWLSDLGIKMEAFAKGPQFTALVDALTKFKDDTLAGVKTGLDNIKISIDSNSETWHQLAKDIEGAIRVLGPVVKWFADLIGTSIGAAIDWFASLYNAIHKVWVIMDRLIHGYDTLPKNGGQEFGTIQRRARGGSALAGRSYLVGDGGEPEILTMGARSGYITPMSDVGAAPAGGMSPIEVHVTVELDGEPVGRRVRTEIREANRGLKRAVLAGAGAR